MRKILVFDLETTGLDKYKDQIVQFAGCIFDRDTKQLIKKFDTYIKPTGNYSISIGAYIKTGISPKMLEDKPELSEVAPTIIELFNECNEVLTYNGFNFDMQFLNNKLNEIGYNINFKSKKCYDSFLIEKERNGIRLEQTFKRYKNLTMEDAGYTAHNAFSDVLATYDVFEAQNEQEPINPENFYGIDNVIVDKPFDNVMLPTFNIGKYKGAPVKYIANIDQNYLKWCISDKCNFVNDTKEFLKQFIDD